MNRVAGLAVLAAVGLASASTGAVSTSINYVDLAPGTDLQTCLNQGEGALSASGLAILDRTASAAWAESWEADALFMVYCIVERGIAVVSASAEQGDRSEEMGVFVDQIVDDFLSPFPVGRK